MNWRQIKFNIIEWTILPLGVAAGRLLAATYRFDDESVAELERVAAEPRAVVATYHGLSLPLLAFSRRLIRLGRVSCVMTSPSRDGRVLDAAIRAFGMKIVKGSSKKRGVEGSLELIEAIKRGQIGLLAIDGPRGPLAVPKKGFTMVARATGAVVYTATASASRSWMLRTWDRMLIPAPFARVRVRFQQLETAGDSVEQQTWRLHRQLLHDSRDIGCPMVAGLSDPEPPATETNTP